MTLLICLFLYCKLSYLVACVICWFVWLFGFGCSIAWFVYLLRLWSTIVMLFACICLRCCMRFVKGLVFAFEFIWLFVVCVDIGGLGCMGYLFGWLSVYYLAASCWANGYLPLIWILVWFVWLAWLGLFGLIVADTFYLMFLLLIDFWWCGSCCFVCDYELYWTSFDFF